MSIRRPTRHQHLPSYSSSTYSEPGSPFRALDSPDPFITARQERDSRDAHNLSTRRTSSSFPSLKEVTYWVRLSNASRGTWIALGLLGTLFVYMMLPAGKSNKMSWAKLYKDNQRGWVPFEPAKHLAAPVDEPELSTPQQLSYECLEQWIAVGTLCEALSGAFAAKDSVDALYTWVNGSDPMLGMHYKAEMMRLGKGLKPKKMGGRRRKNPAANSNPARTDRTAAKHFREHDELRYSLRSLVSAFVPGAISSIHILTADAPAYAFPKGIPKGKGGTTHDPSLGLTTSRIGQVPTWLKPSEINNAAGSPPLRVVHHSDVFTDEKALPTFNSKAIESQLGNIKSLSEVVSYLNDDNFVGLNGDDSFTAADFGSALLGPVYKFQRDLLVDGVSPEEKAGDEDSEWPGLKRAGHLLNNRFGDRRRAYIAHIAKAISVPIYREASMVWRDEFSLTAGSKYRGHQTEYNPFFAASHYHLERHREALLWAFFVARSDQNLDGQLDFAERHDLLSVLGFDFKARKDVVLSGYLPVRSTLDELPALYTMAGIRPPRSTEIKFDSRDGFGLAHGPPSFDTTIRRDGSEKDPVAGGYAVVRTGEFGQDVPRQRAARETCAFALDECLGEGFALAGDGFGTNEVFKRVAFEKPKCGDCAILLLTKASGASGLNAFLPLAAVAAKEKEQLKKDLEKEPHPPFTPLSLEKDYTKIDYVKLAKDVGKAHLRERAVRLIARYGYSVGESLSSFVLMKGKKTLLPQLARLNREFADKNNLGKVQVAPPAFLTLNDDIATDSSSNSVDPVLKAFFKAVWPKPSRFERLD